jgi:hypothetical protein
MLPLNHDSWVRARLLQQQTRNLLVMTYGERLGRAMEHAGADVTALAKACDCSYQAIRQALTGASKALSAENSAEAARFLGVNHYWLATGKGEMLASPEREISPMGQEVLEWFERMTDRKKQARAHSYIYGMCVADRWPDDESSPPAPEPKPEPRRTPAKKTPHA